MPAASNPAARVTWSGPQTGSDHVGMTQNGRLVFSSYQPVSRGMPESYTCSVSNEVTGQQQMSVSISMVDMTRKTCHFSVLLCSKVWLILYSYSDSYPRQH